MEMCYLRGACRSGDIEESGIGQDGTVAKHEKQQKVRRLIWRRLLIPKTSRKTNLKGTYKMRRQSNVLLLISQAKVKASTMWLHLLISHWRLQVYIKEKRG
jgi:hypothetical protein